MRRATPWKVSTATGFGMEQQIRFCTATDGARLAYACAGTGPVLVKAANWLNHLEFDWESPIWRPLLDELTSRFFLLRYDERGNGLSDWDVDDISFEAFVRDLETVVDAAGVERFALFGISQGCAVSIAYAVRHPERVSHLVLHGGFAVGVHARGSPEFVEQHDALMTLLRSGWGRENPAFRQVFTSLFVPEGTPEQMRWFNELQRVTTTPDNAVRLIETFGRIDVRELLPRVSCPTLVLHCRGDARIPFNAGRRIASGIPGARFVPLDSRNHLVLSNEPAFPRFVREITSFLGVETGPPRTSVSGPSLSDDDTTSWRRVDALLEKALELPASERRAFVDGLDDRELRVRLERLLELAETPDDLLASGGWHESPLERQLAEELPATFAPGRDLAGRYRLIERVGRGGMGVVFRAKDLALGREVAIKVAVDPGLDPRWRERLLREARTAAALNHPNLVGVYDVGEADGLPFLVMEFVDGRTAEDAPPDSVAVAVRLAAQVARALDHAHRRGVIHRDLKPANVLVVAGEDGPLAKVADLGIARWERDVRLTRTGGVLGTPQYMAPEQAMGEEVDARADLYALGVLLYCWTTGRTPFRGERALDIVSQHVHAAVVPPRELRPDLPPALEAVILRLLEKEPARRFPSAAEVARALDAL